jgi:hypothetical protein
MSKKRKLDVLGSVPLGAKFIFRTTELLGGKFGGRSKHPYEGQVVTVVGFKPRYVNSVVVCTAGGAEFLMRLDMAEKALSLKSLQVPSEPLELT